VPFPYNIILGRDTALPWTLDHLGAIGIDTAVPAVIRYSSGVHRIFVGEKHSRPYPIDISEILNANASPL
jgi:hypothetical protein